MKNFVEFIKYGNYRIRYKDVCIQYEGGGLCQPTNKEYIKKNFLPSRFGGEVDSTSQRYFDANSNSSNNSGVRERSVQNATNTNDIDLEQQVTAGGGYDSNNKPPYYEDGYRFDSNNNDDTNSSNSDNDIT